MGNDKVYRIYRQQRRKGAPVLWHGAHEVGILAPRAGRSLTRRAFANFRPIKELETSMVGRRVLWCYFDRNSKGETVVLVNGRKLGTVDFGAPGTTPGLRAALDSGITAATVYLHRESDGWHAQIDVGEHRFMPRPYWL